MAKGAHHTRYDTSAVREGERFAFWREAVCDAYVRLGCETESTPFHGAIDIHRYDTIAISTVGGSQQTVTRRRGDIARAGENDFLLSLQRAKRSAIAQAGATALLDPGDFALYSSTDPYVLTMVDGFEELVLQFPKDKLLARLPDGEMLTGQRVDGATGFGALVARNLGALSTAIAGEGPDTRRLIEETMLDLIAAALAGLRRSRYELSRPEQQLVLRARTFIRARLADPALDREMVARALGISVRRLSEIFAATEESVASHIRNQRLERAAADLRDPRYSRQTISEIALRAGFGNFQHFSTLFRKRFGATPRDYRSHPPR